MQEIKNLRIFGIIWAIIFFTISYKYNLNLFFLILSILFLISAAFSPKIYLRTNIFQSWIKVGNFLGHINSKIIIFILFFCVFTPIGLLLKIAKKDLLNKKLDKISKTYFIPRSGVKSDMRNQF